MRELGINTIYFNPIFEAPSVHKYDTSDYRKIDPHFGTMETFIKMAESFHENSIRFILDGVFNHTGRGFFAFCDIEKNGNKSLYKDWYNIKKFPLIENGKPNYDCWWNFPELPKLNTENPEVKTYLIETAKDWLIKGADGWRLDVPNEIAHSFWKDFRREIQSVKPDAFIIGEIWRDGRVWLEGDEFDSVMNYRFRDACVEFFAKRTSRAEEFIQQIGSQVYIYPMKANFCMMNLLSSHDTARFYTVAEGNIIKIRLALAFQFTFIGSPSIYYGDEIGMEGGKDTG